MTFEFTDPKIDRMVALTPSDRRWMDDVVKTVEETWDVVRRVLSSVERETLPLTCFSRRSKEDRASEWVPARPPLWNESSMGLTANRFRGSDDDLRSRFEEYICAALASLKYAEFTGVGGDGNVLQPFSEQWLGAFKKTKAFELWDACTDPVLFDICEPR
jgi:hypothetical protein